MIEHNQLVGKDEMAKAGVSVPKHRRAAIATFGAADILRVVGGNLRALRRRQGLSLDRLAGLSGVSRAMLGQIETGKSAPTVTLLWKITAALGVNIEKLLALPTRNPVQVLRRAGSDEVAAHGGLKSRSLVPRNCDVHTQVHELRLASGQTHLAAPHAEGLRASFYVAQGTVVLTVEAAEPVSLSAGDAVLFEADRPHTLTNPSNTPALAVLVLSPSRTVAR